MLSNQGGSHEYSPARSKRPADPVRFDSADGVWIVGNVGVVPDIELVNDPYLMARGHDPQPERGMAEVLRLLESKKPVLPSKKSDIFLPEENERVAQKMK